MVKIWEVMGNRGNNVEKCGKLWEVMVRMWGVMVKICESL